jgi:hypothetical protein
MRQATAPIGAPLPEKERRRRIARRSGEQIAGHFVPYRGHYVKAPVITVGSDVLVYRAENGRLITRLREHARQHGRDLADLFSQQDSAEVQQLLHRLLVAEAGDPRGPIFDELERQQLQTEPLLITAEGLVVNGNRRLAAMRELLHREPARYAGFAEIAVAMLPADAAPADLEFVEATLQMAPETKLAYGWIDRRLKMRRQRDELGLPLELMCESYRLDDAALIEREIQELALAEDYLDSYRGEPGHYSLIGDAEALFVGLGERLSVLPPNLRRLWRLAGFAMIDGRSQVHGPMDRQFPFAPPAPEHLPASALRSLAEDHDLLTPAEAGDDATVLGPQAQEKLAAVLGDRSRSSELAPELYRVMERLRAELQDQRLPKRVIRQLAKARESLSRLEPDRFSGREGRQLRSELAAIQAQAAYLLGERTEPPVRMAAASTLRRLLGRG